MLGATTSKGEISELKMCWLLWRQRIKKKSKNLHAGRQSRGCQKSNLLQTDVGISFLVHSN